ncbi:Uncharacterised protein [Serratia plymuthica]|uniref:Glycosyltransferase subfamily 4-like N-terminal domain-containing protein n=1 Tax=Serratia plymuthica TaxID=82996 RepID=A0A2X4UBN9_SERPL|nr:Uncharacterised protein [Serratia plymuthica]
MKKICYFINSDWYFDLHWVERAFAAKAAGYEIHVVSHFVGDDILQKLTEKGFVCHNSSVSEQSINPFHFVGSLFKVWRLLKKINPDVLHCITIKPCLMGGSLPASITNLLSWALSAWDGCLWKISYL